MPHYPAHWTADVVLKDGAIAHLRPIRPDDADGIVRFHAAQSPESIYLRFFAPRPRLSARDVERFTVVDHHDRVALVITIGGDIAGVGRYDRISPAAAEVAFNISDAHQGRGLGTVLLEHLVAAALENDIHSFTAEVLPQNHRMRSVFADAGFEVSQHFDDGVISLELSIDATEKSRAVSEAREHAAEARSMHAVFHPESVALIGVSRRSSRAGNRLLHAIQAAGYRGRLYVVHPQAGEIEGVPAFRGPDDLPGPVDLAVIAVPSSAVLEVVDACAEGGVRAVLVASSGFAESGAEGALLQAELVRRTRAGGMRLVGPGSWGLGNADPGVRLNLVPLTDLPKSGRLGVFCESGALSVAVLDLATRQNIGISSFLSAGERADVSANDCLQYWAEDPGTDAIALYLESTGNPRKFFRIARRIGRQKPIIVLTSGTSGFVVGARSPNEAFDSMLTQAGCIRVKDLQMLMDVARLLADQPLPAGDRVAVIANSPSLARLTADTCLARDLRVVRGPIAVEPEADEVFAAAVADAQRDERVDAVVAVHAPIAGGDGRALARLLARGSGDPDRRGTPLVACLIGSHEGPVLNHATASITLPAGAPGNTSADGSTAPDGTSSTSADGSNPVAEPAPSTGTVAEPPPVADPAATPPSGATPPPPAPFAPVPVTGPGESGTEDAQVQVPLRHDPRQVPSYPTPEAAADALAAVVGYVKWRGEDLGRFTELEGIDEAGARALVEEHLVDHPDGVELDQATTAKLLGMYGISLWPTITVQDADEAVAAADQLGWPVALKCSAPQLRHRVDLGGVRLDIEDPDTLRRMVGQMRERIVAVHGGELLVQRMAEPGVACVISCVEDRHFGPVVSFGLGGDASELLGDMAHRIAPLTDRDIAGMIRSIRAAPKLFGRRGVPPADLDSLGDLVTRLAALNDDLHDVAGVEFNPVVVSDKGLAVLSATVRLAHLATRADARRELSTS